MIPLPMGGFMGNWVGTWVGSCQISKNCINCDLIKIIQLCLNIYDMWWYPTYGWVYGWVYVKIYSHQFQQTWYHSKAHDSQITNIVFNSRWLKINELLRSLWSNRHLPPCTPHHCKHFLHTWSCDKNVTKCCNLIGLAILKTRSCMHLTTFRDHVIRMW